MRTGIIMLGMAAVLTAGCGDKVAEKIAEKAIEQAVRQNGGDADVDLKNGKVTVKTDEGEVAVTTGDDIGLPADFPKDIHVIKGAKVKGNVKVPQGHTIMLTVPGSPAAAMKTYKTKMIADGWDEKAAMDMGAQKMLTYSKNGRSATLLIGTEDKETVISITAGSSSLSSKR